MVSGAQYARIKAISYKCLIYFLFFFILAIAQTTFFSKINVLDATPDLLLAALVTVCMRNDRKISSICSIVSGFFYCAIGGSKYYLYLIFSFLCGYVLWILGEHYFSKSYLSFFALSAIAFGIKAVFNIFYISLVSNSFTLTRIIASIVLPEFISSMIFCSISYLIFSIISNLINKKQSQERRSNK